MADGDVVLAVAGPAGGGAVLMLRVDGATGELIAARLFDPLAEHAGRHGGDAALLAADAEHVHRALLFDTGAGAPRGFLITDDQLRGALLFDTGAGAPRGFLITDDQLRGALLARDGLLIVGSLATRGVHQVGFALLPAASGPGGHHGRGLLPASTLFLDGLVTEPGATAALLPTPEAEDWVVVRVFAADNDRSHGPQIAATEDQGLGRPLLAALVVSIGARGDQNTPVVVFEVEKLRCGRSTATDRGRHDELLADSVVVRVFITADDGSHGPFISATGDQCFGRSLLAAFAVSSGASGDRSAQVVFQVEVLRRGLYTAAAGDHRFEHVSGRGLLTFPRNARGPGDGLASSTATPSTSLRRAVVAPPPSSVARGATRKFVLKIRNSVGKKRWIKKGRLGKICSKNLVKFRSLLGDFVWFAVPSVLLFFPRKAEGNEQAKGYKQQLKPHLSLLEMLNPEDPSIEKRVVMSLFVIFLSIWIMAYVLASLGRGKNCVKLVGILTYMTMISIIAFMDYMLSKTMPQDMLYKVLFGLHFTIMAYCITQVWRVFVKETTWQLPSLPKFQDMVNKMKTWCRWPSRPQENNHQGENSLSEPLMVHEMV
ncbi:hypothetical protein SEVIR_4G239800v4 [Setaria viridis]|uniref:Uncharacterized protein n=1 Tax=Setaria viridis TaxID=4556 RepID=A0A4U6V0P8_SETVI|nr:uncharacterized protein LOC117852919 [Setaria viridis]TKW22610.1 hypothetical protein SEVIR_4G239800v2 [Setaria viridis]TKW22611.1 hypothetical protein SEVIR_4G239800v2 [Setaria viridis]